MITLHGVRLTQTPEQLVDIVIEADKIASITPTRLRPRTGIILDGDGRLAFPGFIDAHVHGEAAVFDRDVQLALLRQGITSIVVGQDGVSFAPTRGTAAGDLESGSTDETFRWASDYFTAINGKHPSFAGGSVAQLLATYRDLPVNVAYLAPHGTIRHAVMGEEQRVATDAEISQMVVLLREAISDGARGLSTGLEYAPSRYADRRELVALLAEVATADLLHVSHMRGYEAEAGPAVAELVDLALATGVKTHISHYHGPGADLIAMVDDALNRGVDLTFDSYPYLRGCSILSMLTMPEWIPVAEPDRAVEMLHDCAVVERLLTQHLSSFDEIWPRVTLAAVPGKYERVEGQKLIDVAAEWDMSPAETALELLRSTRLAVGCVFAQPPTNSAASVAQLLRHEAHMGGSDAIYAGGHPHPRGWGAFAKFLADHVRAAGDWSWEQAEQHLARAAGDRFHLGRGRLKVGSVADVVLIDPDTVADRATYEDPRQTAVGIDDVLVAGRQVLRAGELTAARPGRAL
ncbi:MAG TPA: amidohydrolase family protein [Actinomycetales bacterium]|nr:amidohydrolase family protein [Actinomycetales bacterium]